MSLVERLRNLCKQKGVSFNQFEIESGVGRGTAAKWDTNSPSIEKVSKAAEYFNISVSYLLGEENEKTASPTADGLSEYDIKALAWFHSLSPEKRKAILSLADGPEELAELPDRE